MYIPFRHYKTIPPIDISVSILVSAILAVINFQHDLILTSDTSTFIRWADLLISHNFDFVAYIEDNIFTTPPFFYTLPVYLIALLKVTAGERWEHIFHIINIFSLIFTIEMFRRCTRLLNINILIVSALLPLFLISTDYIVWPHYLLTDTIFAALVMASIHASFWATLNKKSCLAPIICCLLLLIARPSSLPFAISIFLFLIFFRLPIPAASIQRLAWYLPFTIIVIAIAYATIFEAVLVSHLVSEQLAFIASMIGKGIVIHDRPDTFIAMTPTIFDIARLFLLRWIMFFSPHASTFSTSHIIANCATLFPFFVCAIAWVSHPFDRNVNELKSAQFLLFIAIIVSLFHAATVIDFDWRYRFPVIAPMYLFVALILNFCTKYVLVLDDSSRAFRSRQKESLK